LRECIQNSAANDVLGYGAFSISVDSSGDVDPLTKEPAMRGTTVDRKSPYPVDDRLRLAEIGRTLLGAVVGAFGGMILGAVYASVVTILFGAMGGAIVGMIVNELEFDNQA
jgi:hypothetical protein